MFKDLIQIVGLHITSFTVSGDIKEKKQKTLKKKNYENDQLTVHFQSFLFILIFAPPPPPPVPKSEKKFP